MSYNLFSSIQCQCEKNDLVVLYSLLKSFSINAESWSLKYVLLWWWCQIDIA